MSRAEEEILRVVAVADEKSTLSYEIKEANDIPLFTPSLLPEKAVDLIHLQNKLGSTYVESICGLRRVVYVNAVLCSENVSSPIRPRTLGARCMIIPYELGGELTDENLIPIRYDTNCLGSYSLHRTLLTAITESLQLSDQFSIKYQILFTYNKSSCLPELWKYSLQVFRRGNDVEVPIHVSSLLLNYATMSRERHTEFKKRNNFQQEHLRIVADAETSSCKLFKSTVGPMDFADNPDLSSEELTYTQSGEIIYGIQNNSTNENKTRYLKVNFSRTHSCKHKKNADPPLKKKMLKRGAPGDSCVFLVPLQLGGKAEACNLHPMKVEKGVMGNYMLMSCIMKMIIHWLEELKESDPFVRYQAAFSFGDKAFPDRPTSFRYAVQFYCKASPHFEIPPLIINLLADWNQPSFPKKEKGKVIAREIADFVPIVGSVFTIVDGVKLIKTNKVEGVFLATGGAAELVTDVASLGLPSLAKNIVKTGIKSTAKVALKTEFKTFGKSFAKCTARKVSQKYGGKLLASKLVASTEECLLYE